MANGRHFENRKHTITRHDNIYNIATCGFVSISWASCFDSNVRKLTVWVKRHSCIIATILLITMNLFSVFYLVDFAFQFCNVCIILCFFYIHEGCYVVACLCLSVCQSARWLKKKFGRIVTNVYWWVGIVTSNSWLDFGGDPNHNMNTGIFRWNFCH